MKLAVASKDGLSINVHFGHAKRFAIYEVSSTACRLVEERDQRSSETSTPASTRSLTAAPS